MTNGTRFFKELQAAFISLPPVFTGAQMSRAGIALGIPITHFNCGGAADFLKQYGYAKNVRPKSKTWHKTPVGLKLSGLPPVAQPPVESGGQSQAEVCISYLKARGYKVSKPVTTYEEV